MSQSVPRLIQALLNPAVYDAPVDHVELVETHISWLLLTGKHVYKIKKPVNLGFLDFTTLELRRHYCEEELRLNRRFSPELYLDVATVTGSPNAPRWSATGVPLEYAVRMAQFDSRARLDRVLARGELTEWHLDQLANVIAQSHLIAAAIDPASLYGQPETLHRQLLRTLDDARTHLPQSLHPQIEHLRVWCERRHVELRPLLAERRGAGRVRECHGDLHLENLVLLDDAPRLFDCLEFNPDLRWIDVVCDLAFTTMDLHARGRSDFAHRLLGAYIEQTADDCGLATLSYFQVYRASVRAAVAGIRAGQEGVAEVARQELIRSAIEYLKLAQRLTRPCSPAVVLMHGLSGSGKSTISQSLLESLGTIRLRSDVERRRAPAADASHGDRYHPDNRAAVYQAMAQRASAILQAGSPVIVDATFLRRADRAQFQALANRLGVPWAIVHAQAPRDELERRVHHRQCHAHDPSDAGLAVLAQQSQELEPLDADEIGQTVVVDSTDPDSVSQATVRVAQLCSAG